jgi:tetratricopeptide (TPR) repeat protein
VTFYNVGVAYYNAKDYDNAIQYFQKSVTVDPKFTDGYFQIGLTYVAKGDNPKAIEAFKKVIEIDPSSESAKEAQEFINSIK